MRIIADIDRCVGSGQCVLAEPGVFALDDDEGVVSVLEPRPAGAAAQRARGAVRLCPSGALTVVGD
jgi:ferredoxin